MSTRKQFPLRSTNTTPKLVNKSTPKKKFCSAEKACGSSKIANSSSRNISVSINTAPIIDPFHSQKYMQHKLDMAYNKYLQNIYLKNVLSKMHKDTEIAVDEQLVHAEEMYQTVLDDLLEKKDHLENISHVKNIASKIQTLDLLDKVTTSISDTNIIENIKKLNHNLHFVCDKLIFENMKFISTDENYEELQIILQEISAILSEINDTNDEIFVDLVEHICEIKELVTKLKKNQEVATNYQHKINNLVLREASKELSKQMNM